MRETFKFLAVFQDDGSIHVNRVEEPVATRYDVLFTAIHIHEEKFLAGVYIARNNIIGDKLTKTQTDQVIESIYVEVNKLMGED